MAKGGGGATTSQTSILSPKVIARWNKFPQNSPKKTKQAGPTCAFAASASSNFFWMLSVVAFFSALRNIPGITKIYVGAWPNFLPHELGHCLTVGFKSRYRKNMLGQLGSSPWGRWWTWKNTWKPPPSIHPVSQAHHQKSESSFLGTVETEIPGKNHLHYLWYDNLLIAFWLIGEYHLLLEIYTMAKQPTPT